MRNIKKGQSVNEITLIACVVGVIVLGIMIPFGGQIASFLQNSSPVKNNTSSILANLVSLFGANSTTFSTNYQTLQNSNNPDTKDFASNVANVVNTAGNIKSGNGSIIIDNDFAQILSSLKSTQNSNTQETSGSVASFITSSLDEGMNVTTAEKSAASEVKNVLGQTYISLNVTDTVDQTPVTKVSDTTANLLKDQITSGLIPRTALVYDGASYIFNGSPVTAEAIQTFTPEQFETFYTQNFSGSTVNSLVNTYLAIDNVSKTYKLPSDLTQQFNTLKDQTKKALTVQ